MYFASRQQIEASAKARLSKASRVNPVAAWLELSANEQGFLTGTQFIVNVFIAELSLILGNWSLTVATHPAQVRGQGELQLAVTCHYLLGGEPNRTLGRKIY